MTAILYFYTDDGKRLTVIADRQVTHDYELREKGKCFLRGKFYIFCSGSEDIYNQVMSEVTPTRKNIGNLAIFINKRCIEIINIARTSLSIPEDVCSFLIVDGQGGKARLIKRNTISETQDFGIIGSGESYEQEMYGIFSSNRPGFQLRTRSWQPEIFLKKIVEVFDRLSFKQSSIGHPALFGLDLFLFESGTVESQRIRRKDSLKLNDISNYEVKSYGA